MNEWSNDFKKQVIIDLVTMILFNGNESYRRRLMTESGIYPYVDKVKSFLTSYIEKHPGYTNADAFKEYVEAMKVLLDE